MPLSLLPCSWFKTTASNLTKHAYSVHMVLLQSTHSQVSEVETYHLIFPNMLHLFNQYMNVVVYMLGC